MRTWTRQQFFGFIFNVSVIVIALMIGCKIVFAETPLDRARDYVGSGKMTILSGNWCADFVVLVYGESLPVEPSRSAKQLWNRMRSAGLETTAPQAGDLIFFWRESPTSWKGHVGIVESVRGSRVTTIEGNVGGRVVRRVYEGEIPRLLGFGRAS